MPPRPCQQDRRPAAIRRLFNGLTSTLEQDRFLQRYVKTGVRKFELCVPQDVVLLKTLEALKLVGEAGRSLGQLQFFGWLQPFTLRKPMRTL